MFSMTVAAMRRHRFAAAAALAAALLVPAAAAAAAPAAQASVSRSAAASGYGGSRAGNAALNWAERHAAGCWYSYGGSSCSRGYDCSGLVMEAFGHGAGIWLPHSTYAMLGNPHLHRIPLSQARRGDLMFSAPGTWKSTRPWYHQTFGAHSSGQRVGWDGGGHGGIPRPRTGSGDPAGSARLNTLPHVTVGGGDSHSGWRQSRSPVAEDGSRPGQRHDP